MILCAAACAALFVCALAGTLLTFRRTEVRNIEILSRGNVIYSGPGTVSGKPKYIEVRTELGINLVRIDETGVCVESADCPDLECVHSGYLKNRVLPVVCLPNELIIRYTDDPDRRDENEELDAISR